VRAGRCIERATPAANFADADIANGDYRGGHAGAGGFSHRVVTLAVVVVAGETTSWPTTASAAAYTKMLVSGDGVEGRDKGKSAVSINPVAFRQTRIRYFNHLLGCKYCVDKQLIFELRFPCPRRSDHYPARKSPMKRAILYLRVSTPDQTTANQERELREVAARMGIEVVKTYHDHGISGAKGRDKRPAFNAMCKALARREANMVMAWSVDRLGRSLQDLVTFLSEIHALGVDLFLHQQGLDTTTPSGKAMFGMLSVFSEFERAMIQERVRAGLARAKAEGKRLGRPKVNGDVETAIRAALKRKESVRQISAQVGVSPGTVQRISRELSQAVAR
jgi:DNA invertase Pin-like site-specific DNA recombinase